MSSPELDDASQDVPVKGTRGRPRRFEPEHEKRMIIEAAHTVMRRNDYQDVTIGEILAEAGMSTRSFYRHFTSKDELLCAMYRRDAERAAELLRVRVASAETPRLALEAWIDEILSFGYIAPRASRVAVMSSPSAMRAEGYAAESEHALDLLVSPLVEVLERGARDGTFPHAEPVLHAEMIYAVAVRYVGIGPFVEPRAMSARRACSVVTHFCLRALGADAPG